MDDEAPDAAPEAPANPTGRPRGPARPTKAMAVLAEQAMSKRTGQKKAKEVLEEFMMVFAGVAARYQPRYDDPNDPTKLTSGNLTDFERWAKLAVQTATELAPYQDPTFRAMMVAPPPPPPGRTVRRLTLTIFDTIGNPAPEYAELPEDAVLPPPDQAIKTIEHES